MQDRWQDKIKCFGLMKGELNRSVRHEPSSSRSSPVEKVVQAV